MELNETTYRAADADALLAWARGGNDWGYLEYAAGRVDVDLSRHVIGDEIGYSTLALELARRGVSWQRICQWKK